MGYYTIKSLEYLLNKNNLYIVEAKTTESYGGSLRVVISKNIRYKESSPQKKDYFKIKAFEEANQINSPSSLLIFNEKMKII